MRWLQFILSHSIFIAFCAVALCWQTSILLQVPHHTWLYGFVFFSTLSSYNFYWLLSKFSFAQPGSLPAFLHKNLSYLLLFLIALAGMLLSFFKIDIPLSRVLIAVMLTTVYSLPLWPFAFTRRLRKLGFAKTGLLAFTWAYVTVILPASTVSPGIHETTLLLLAARFFFMLMLCSIFDQRDSKMDKLKGLHSLATDVSDQALRVIMAVSFIGYMAAGIWVRTITGASWQLAGFVITGLLVWWVYRLSLKKQGYNFYYFVVDGLMLVSALLTLLASKASLISF